MKKKYSEKFMNQKMMRTVMVALLPIAILSIYLFGLRVLLLYGVVTLSAVITEWIFVRSRGGKYQKQFLYLVFYTL